jgi:hypothetical protein
LNELEFVGIVNRVSMRTSAIAIGLVSVTLAGCVGARPLPVRLDPVQRLGGERHLEGVRVSVRSVHDRRPEQNGVGRHRDGFLRVTQYRYVPRESMETTIEAAVHRALADAGAVVVDMSAPSDVVIDVGLTAFDVTSDAPLAGEETFGVVGIDLRVAAGERVLGHAAVTWPFAVDGVQDPGMVGDALQRAIGVAVRRIPKPA